MSDPAGGDEPPAAFLSGTPGRVTLSGLVIDAHWPTARLLGLALLSGRILLSFLPPGEPGGHSLRKLPLTIAASLLLGLGLMGAFGELFGEGWIAAAVFCVAGLLLRWASAPAGIVPRHELARERGSWLSRGLLLAALLFGCFPEPRPAAVLLVLCLEHGLATARRAPLGRRALVLLLALFLFREQSLPDIGAAYLGCGAAFALAWLRRADRRSAALAIACLALGRCWSTFDGALLAAGALLALVLCTAPASRPWITKACLIGFALCVAPAVGGMHWAGAREWSRPLAGYARLALVIATLASVFWIGRSAAARARPEPAEWRAALAAGDRFLMLLFVIVVGLAWLLPEAVDGLAADAGMLAAAPVAFLLAGCVSIRPERAA